MDIRDPKQHDEVYSLVEDLEAGAPGGVEPTATPAKRALARALVRSRSEVRRIDWPLHVGIVFAMWREHNRLHPWSDGNPFGEDSLRQKLRQLHWLFAGSSVTWTLYAVDDGCPFGSGAWAKRLLEGHPLASRARVLFIEDALGKEGPLATLTSVHQSRKGGAIVHGAHVAVREGADVVVYCDSDLSVHLGQVGLLLGPFARGEGTVVVGDRHAEGSFVQKHVDWGVALLRHIHRLLAPPVFAHGLLDTNAGFKLYARETFLDMLPSLATFDLSFDTDWLIAASKLGARPRRVPYVVLDSSAESSVQHVDLAWRDLTHGLIEQMRRHGLPYDEEMARVVEEEINSKEEALLLLGEAPPELKGVPLASLGSRALMPPARVREWLREKKRRRASTSPAHAREP